MSGMYVQTYSKITETIAQKQNFLAKYREWLRIDLDILYVLVVFLYYM